MPAHHRYTNQAESRIECPTCDSDRVRTVLTQHRFKYGADEGAVELGCELPVRVCEECQTQFVDEVGESARHEAVCRHFGLMTPAQVQALRHRYGMTQSSFSELTGIGEASLSRWENGASFQTKAFDNYLYLLGSAENIRRLRERVSGELPNRKPSLRVERRFRCIKTTEARVAQARRFVLRPAARG